MEDEDDVIPVVDNMEVEVDEEETEEEERDVIQVNRVDDAGELFANGEVYDEEDEHLKSCIDDMYAGGESEEESDEIDDPLG